MRVYRHFNKSGPPCAICGTKKDKQAVLVPIHGTLKEGICQCEQLHLECFNVWVIKEKGKLFFCAEFPDKSGTTRGKE